MSSEATEVAARRRASKQPRHGWRAAAGPGCDSADSAGSARSPSEASESRPRSPSRSRSASKTGVAPSSSSGPVGVTAGPIAGSGPATIPTLGRRSGLARSVFGTSSRAGAAPPRHGAQGVPDDPGARRAEAGAPWPRTGVR